MKTSAEIKKEVMDELKRNSVLGSCDIKVDVVGSTVYLSGKVDSYHKRFEAGNIVRKMEDVKRVQPDIYVALPQEDKKTDAQIKSEIKKILHSALPNSDILVRVYDGIVVLAGEADFEYQKASATTAILDVKGILNIWNFIRVKEKLNTVNFKEKNKPVFGLNVQINANQIRLKDPLAV